MLGDMGKDKKNRSDPKPTTAFREAPSIRPSWLMAMIPPDWLAVATKLCQLQMDHNVSGADMEKYIGVAANAPIPLVVAVEKFITKEWIIEVDPLTNTIHVKDGIILPDMNEVNKFKKG